LSKKCTQITIKALKATEKIRKPNTDRHESSNSEQEHSPVSFTNSSARNATITLQQFNLIKVLGKGSFGKGKMV